MSSTVTLTILCICLGAYVCVLILHMCPHAAIYVSSQETSDDDAERRMRVRELIDSGVCLKAP
jgi:hypothetical protein